MKIKPPSYFSNLKSLFFFDITYLLLITYFYSRILESLFNLLRCSLLPTLKVYKDANIKISHIEKDNFEIRFI